MFNTSGCNYCHLRVIHYIVFEYNTYDNECGHAVGLQEAKSSSTL